MISNEAQPQMDSAFAPLGILTYTKEHARALELDGSGAAVSMLMTRYAEVVSLSRAAGKSAPVLVSHMPGRAPVSLGPLEDFAALPLPKGCFNLILGRSVLNQSAPGVPDCSSHARRLQFLIIARGHLSGGGKLVLGAENLLGRRHAGRRRGNAKTLWGYRRLLREAGFSRVSFHLAIPSIENTKSTCRLAGPSLRAYHRIQYPKPAGALLRLSFDVLAGLGISQYFESAYFIEAYA